MGVLKKRRRKKEVNDESESRKIVKKKIIKSNITFEFSIKRIVFDWTKN